MLLLFLARSLLSANSRPQIQMVLSGLKITITVKKKKKKDVALLTSMKRLIRMKLRERRGEEHPEELSHPQGFSWPPPPPSPLPTGSSRFVAADVGVGLVHMVLLSNHHHLKLRKKNTLWLKIHKVLG